MCMRSFADRFRCGRLLLLLPLLLLGACMDSAAPFLDDLPREVRTVRAAAGYAANGSWSSVVRDGRITAIREVAGQFGHVRLRVYAYDSTGRVRDYSERLFATSDSLPLRASDVSDTIPLAVDAVPQEPWGRDTRRVSVHFRADVAMLMAGRERTQAVTLPQRELKSIVVRAARLYDLATKQGQVK